MGMSVLLNFLPHRVHVSCFEMDPTDDVVFKALLGLGCGDRNWLPYGFCGGWQWCWGKVVRPQWAHLTSCEKSSEALSDATIFGFKVSAADCLRGLSDLNWVLVGESTYG